MELNKFEIVNCSTGLPREHNAFTTGLRWIRGVGVEMASSSSGQHDRSGWNPVKPWAIKNLNTAAALVFDPELGDPDASAMHQAGSGFDTLSKDIHQSPAGAVLHVQHTMLAVGCFKGGRKGPIGIAVERHAEGKQPFDAVGRLVHQETDGIAITEACSGLQGVLPMEEPRVSRTRHRGDAPLRPAA